MARTVRAKGISSPHPAHLIVVPSGKHYEMMLTTVDGGRTSFTSGAISMIDFTAPKLNEEANRLHDTVNAWSSAPAHRSLADVERLRKRGAEMANLIFPDGGTAFADALIATGRELVIVVWPSERTGFPWQLLWVAEKGKWLGELAAFAGVHDSNGGGDFSGLVKSQGIFAGYAEDDTLQSSRKDWNAAPGRTDEYSSLEILAPGKVEVDPLGQFTAGRLTPNESDGLQKWLGAGRHIYHFACHSVGGTTANPVSTFLVRKSAEVVGSDFKARMSPGAFMLNICSSSIGAIRDSDSLAATLIAAGARGGIATTNDISDRFGTLFARGVYREMARNGGTLFDAFRTAQTKLVKRLGHPMALFYVMHGDTTYTLKE